MFNPNQMIANTCNCNNGMTNQMIPFDPITNLNNQVNLLERQVIMLDQRLKKLEAVDNSDNEYYNEPDSSMYML